MLWAVAAEGSTLSAISPRRALMLPVRPRDVGTDGPDGCLYEFGTRLGIQRACLPTTCFVGSWRLSISTTSSSSWSTMATDTPRRLVRLRNLSAYQSLSWGFTETSRLVATMGR